MGASHDEAPQAVSELRFPALAGPQAQGGEEVTYRGDQAKWERPRAGNGHYAPKALAERFWEKVARTDGCWKWLGSIATNGYGQLGVRGRSRVSHRIAWELTNGPVPQGLYVLHRCDVRSCVNPSHLFLGTLSDNMRDCARKGRVYSPKGEASHSAKLSDDQVRQIRTAWALGGGKIRKTDLGRRFGVSSMHIFRIVSGSIRTCA